MRDPGQLHSRIGRAAALALATFGVACSSGEPAAVPSSLLVIVVDTLRADHLGCYGYERATSPSIDALAARGVRFEHAYATASWTKPSIASMLTGLHPAALGIDNIFSRLPDAADTLAEILARNGYRTAAVVSHVMLSNQWDMGFGQGYESYDEAEARGHEHVSTHGVTERAIAQLATLTEQERPFLLFVHYFDPHFEYRVHDDVDFAGPATRDGLGDENIVALRERLPELDDDDFGYLRDRYDEEIRHTDAGIGRLLAALAESGRGAETLVVLTADHGEELGEKGWIGHTRTLYDFVLRVPLVMALPGRSDPRVVDEPVSLVALTPTLLELLGVDAGSASFHGSPFTMLALDDVRADIAPPPVFAEIDFPLQDPRISPVRLRKRALVDGHYKLIADDERGAVSLYDLDTDPHERNDLARELPAVRDAMLEELRKRARMARVGGPEAEDVSLSREEIEVLEKLGYVEPRSETRMPLSPDRRP